MKLKINSSDECPYCQHRFEDAEQGKYVIYSKARAKWLEEAAQELAIDGGDDRWVDWMDEGKRLTKLGE